MKNIILSILFAVGLTAHADYVSTNAPVTTDTPLTITIVADPGSWLYADPSGTFIGAADGSGNYVADSFSNSNPLAGLFYDGAGNWTIQVPNGGTIVEYNKSGGYDGYAGTYTSVFYPSLSAVVYGGSAPPSIQPRASCSGVTFWPTNGGSAALTARGISSSNNVVLITVNSNVVFQSNPTTVKGGLWRLSGRIEMDASNNLTTAISMSGAGGDAVQFTTLTNQSSTNFTFAIGPNTVLADTNLTLTAVSLVANQGVAGVQGDFEYPAPSSGGGGGGITNFSITATNLPSTNPPTAVVTGVTNGIAYVFLGIPQGAGNTNNYFTTNTVTVQQFTNSWLGSQELTTYSTNYIFWAPSNYLGRVNGYYKSLINGGNDGGVFSSGVPAPLTVSLMGSLNGSNGWFLVTNGYTTTNMISLAILTNGLSAFGAPQNGANGGAIVYTVDHFELLGRTNYGFGQHYQFDAPVNGNDAATKTYADTLFNNAFNNNWSSFTSNGVNHFIYSYQNSTVADIASITVWLPVFSGVIDGTGTNLLMTIYQTNMPAVYQVQSSTNLALVAGFTPFSNYTVATNSGIVTFTHPINFAEPMRFFRVIASSSSTAAFNVPLTLNVGALYPSNTFNLAEITNRLAALGVGKHFWTGSSNGQALITLSYSNGVVRYVRADY